MRTLHFYVDRQRQELVQGINANNSLNDLVFVQDDDLEIIVHNVERSPETPARTAFVEKPLDFTGIRASLGYIDAAPKRSTFKLRIVGETQTTAALTWPEDLSTEALRTAWKASVLAAIKGLTSVGANGVTLDDLPDTPANFFYLTWTDPERADLLEVVENRLIPATNVIAQGSLTDVGFTQILKFVQFPLAMTNNFTRPTPPAITVIETRPGSSGTNAEQTLVVPAAAMGSVNFTWNGASTRTMGVSALTAAQIQTALNEIVTDGATNPSFRVEQRATREGKRFAVELIGPLAGAAQSLIGVAMRDQESVPYARGTLDLEDFHLGLEQALNGAASAEMYFELAIAGVNGGGEETILRTATIKNDMTSAATPGDAAQAGVVLVKEITYIESGGEQYAEAAPGFIFTTVAGGPGFSINHGLGTWYPRVTVHRQTDDDPETWGVMVHGGEFTVEATDEDHALVTFAHALVDDAASIWHYAKFKIFVSSPDEKIIIFSHEHTWAQIRESLPDGDTLVEKFAAIDAALGMIDGTVPVAASQITGKLTSDQIDLASLSIALVGESKFLETLRTLIVDPTIISNISKAQLTNTDFINTIKELVGNADVLEATVAALSGSSDFQTLMSTTLIAALQAGASLPDGALLINLADVVESYPPSPVAGRYAGLTAAVDGLTSGGNISGQLALGDGAQIGKYFTTNGPTWLPTSRGLRKIYVPSGETLVCTADAWFRAVVDDDTGYPLDLDRELFTFTLNEEMLSASTRFAVNFTIGLKLLGNTRGQYLLELRSATLSAEAGPLNLEALDWDTVLFSQRIVLGSAEVMHTFGYAIEVDAENTATATKTIYTATSSADTPTELNCVIQARLVRFDTENSVADPRGQITLTMRNARASVVKIT